MKSVNTSRGVLLGEILENYFSEDDIRLISERFLNKTVLLLDKEIEIDLLDLRLQIDFLLTYAQNKLNKETYIRLMIHLGEFTTSSGEFNSAIEIFERIIHCTKKDRNLNGITSNAYLALGGIYSLQAKWEMSIGYIKKADTIFRKIKDLRGSARCSNLLGTIYGDFGELRIAEKHFQKCLDYLKDTRDEALKGMVEINIGIIQNMRGNPLSAVMYLQRALAKFQTIQDKKRLAEIRYNIGAAYLKSGDFDAALNEFDSAYSLAAEGNYLTTIALTLVSKAYIYVLKEDIELASIFSDKAMEICFRINDRLSVAEVYKIKGIIQRNLKNYELSESYLLTSLRINNELQNKLNYAESSLELGILYEKMYLKQESDFHISNAVNYFRKINAKEEINKIESYLSS